MIDRDRTIAVVCGASAWPKISRFEAAQAFSNTAGDVRNYLIRPTGLGLADLNILDLFDSDADVLTQYRRLQLFLAERRDQLGSKQGEDLTILFWYVGHGALLGPRGADYCLLIRDTDESFGAESSFRVVALGAALKRVAPMSSRVVVLDCCHAGEAAHLLQGGLENAVNAQLSRDVAIDRGVALLAASSAAAPARLESSTTRTLFGQATLSVLTDGSPQHGQALSLREVCDLARLRLGNSDQPNPPMPEVHSPSQPTGDLASKPLFPNPAFVASTRYVGASVHIDTLHTNTGGAIDLLSARQTGGATEHLPPRSVHDLHRELLEAPLVEALRAARVLAVSGDSDLTELVETLPQEEWRRRLLRLALQGAGQQLAPLLIQRILEADHDRSTASGAVQMLSPALHDHAADDLGSRLRYESRVEASRWIVEALGRLGAAGYAGGVVRRLGAYSEGDDAWDDEWHDEWDKLAFHVSVALARMVRWCGDIHDSWPEIVRDTSMGVLASFLAKYKDQSNVRGALWGVYHQMRGLRAWHADRLIRDFLGSADDTLVDLGATALGHMRLARGVPAIIRRLKAATRVSPDVEQTLLLELARIGGPSTVEFLRGEGSRFAAASTALSRCLDSAPDSQFEALVHQSLDQEPAERWWIYRAIGQRPLASLVAYLEQGLVSDEPSDRGVAALALAKSGGSAHLERLATAHHEAAASNEEILTAVALLVAGGDFRPVESVEATLASEVWQFEPVLIDDVARALEGWGGARGLELATGLRWLSTAP